MVLRRLIGNCSGYRRTRQDICNPLVQYYTAACLARARLPTTRRTRHERKNIQLSDKREEFAESSGLPMRAVLGGAETMYPEFIGLLELPRARPPPRISPATGCRW